ncbi:ABC transporter ATP-binding protein [Dellaglioa sp. BT-FLS60]
MIKVMKNRVNLWAIGGAFVFMIVQVICDLYLPTLTSDMINKGVSQGNVSYIWQVGYVMLGVAAIGIVAAVGNVFIASRLAQKLGRSLRSNIYKKVLNFSSYEFDQIGNSSLITRTSTDVLQIQNVTVMMLRMMIQAPIMLIGASVLAYNKQKELTVIFLVAVPILFILIAAVMTFAVPLFKTLQKRIDHINLVFREGLTGVRVIRAFNQDAYEQKRFDGVNKAYTDNARKVFSITAVMSPMMTLVLSATNIAIIWYGGHLIGDMSMQVGNLVAFMTYAMQILSSFMMLSMVFVMLPRAQAAAARINEVLDKNDSIEDRPNAITVDRRQLGASQLSFDKVNFRYAGAEKAALTDINFEAKAGQTIAIIGGTGSGKSTLINLIPRLFDVESGDIKIDGQSIYELTQASLHDQISLVQQKTVLFKGTIRSNLQFGNETATDEQMWHALEIAQAKSFVEESADGLDGMVEQGGDNFSGGQKQRLAIARALVKKASVYLFDDSFSALDFKTDAKLRDSLKTDANVKDSVVLIVAQRISSVTGADLILVIDGGKIVGKGTHEELKATNKTYQEIMQSQIREGDAE